MTYDEMTKMVVGAVLETMSDINAESSGAFVVGFALVTSAEFSAVGPVSETVAMSRRQRPWDDVQANPNDWSNYRGASSFEKVSMAMGQKCHEARAAGTLEAHKRAAFEMLRNALHSLRSSGVFSGDTLLLLVDTDPSELAEMQMLEVAKSANAKDTFERWAENMGYDIS